MSSRQNRKTRQCGSVFCTPVWVGGRHVNEQLVRQQPSCPPQPSTSEGRYPHRGGELIVTARGKAFGPHVDEPAPLARAVGEACCAARDEFMALGVGFGTARERRERERGRAREETTRPSRSTISKYTGLYNWARSSGLAAKHSVRMLISPPPSHALFVKRAAPVLAVRGHNLSTLMSLFHTRPDPL